LPAMEEVPKNVRTPAVMLAGSARRNGIAIGRG
jgi:hypothetical protein